MILSGLLIQETLNHRLVNGSVHLVTTSYWQDFLTSNLISLNLVSSSVKLSSRAFIKIT